MTVRSPRRSSARTPGGTARTAAVENVGDPLQPAGEHEITPERVLQECPTVAELLAFSVEIDRR